MSPIKQTFVFGLATIALGLMMLFRSVNSAAFADESTKPGNWIEMFNGWDLSGWVAEGVKEFTDNDNQVKPVWSVKDVDQTQYDEIKNKPLQGYVRVQNHGKLIEFRNLKLKKLP